MKSDKDLIDEIDAHLALARSRISEIKSLDGANNPTGSGDMVGELIIDLVEADSRATSLLERYRSRADRANRKARGSLR